MATATNNNAITFNAANFDFLDYGLIETNKFKIHNYYIVGEVLSGVIGPARYGTYIPVLPEIWNEYTVLGVNIKLPAPIKKHSMKAFKEAWNLEWKWYNE